MGSLQWPWWVWLIWFGALIITYTVQSGIVVTF